MLKLYKEYIYYICNSIIAIDINSFFIKYEPLVGNCHRARAV